MKTEMKSSKLFNLGENPLVLLLINRISTDLVKKES
jgi:hypothetical protein